MSIIGKWNKYFVQRYSLLVLISSSDFHIRFERCNEIASKMCNEYNLFLDLSAIELKVLDAISM